MKKTIAILTTVMAAGALSAFGQGYVLFGTGTHSIYNDTTGTGAAVTLNAYDVAFIWAATTDTDPLGAGLPTTGTESAGADISTIQNMINSGGWTVGANNATGVEADGASGNLGASSYNGGSSFALQGSSAGGTYDVVTLAWSNEGGTVNTLSAALAGNNIGFSSEFTYATGATSTSSLNNFSQDGMSAFGIAPVPEPATLALAGLGGLSMLFLRRRKA